MKIYVDADGCPVVDLSIKLAKEYNLDIVVVKNYAHRIKNNYAEVISVDISRDSADFYIVNRLEASDIVITQDYGLAAMVLSKKATPINQNGLNYTDRNIEGMLGQRHIHRELRQQGKYVSKSKKRKSQADLDFQDKLRLLIESRL